MGDVKTGIPAFIYRKIDRTKDDKDHSREFMRIAGEMKEKYGLDITKTGLLVKKCKQDDSSL